MAHEIKLAVFLHQVHRLIDDALLRLVVTHFGVAGGREVLAQRVTAETIIRQDAAQIRVAGKQDADMSKTSRSNQLAEG